MQVAARSYLAAGVAVLGVGALAAGPVAPPLPDVQVPKVSTAAVQLNALVNPLEEFAAVFETAAENAGALGARFAENPAPILSNIIANQRQSAEAIAALAQTFGASFIEAISQTPQLLQSAIDDLATGDISGGLNTLLQVAIGPILDGAINILIFQPEIYADFQNALRQPIANLLNVIDLTSPTNLLGLLGPVLSPVNLLTDTVSTIGAAGDALVAALEAGDAEAVANAVLSFGPDLTGTVLNGLNPSEFFAAGLLGSNGVAASLLDIRDAIADAIAPQAPTADLLKATETSTPESTSVTLQIAAPTETRAETVAHTADSDTATDVTDESGPETTPASDATDVDATAEADADATAPATSTTGPKHRAQRDNPVSSALKKLRSLGKKSDAKSEQKPDKESDTKSNTESDTKSDKKNDTDSGDSAA
ncbi:hypothetical protein O6P37_26385 [Mycobacterium sp. CPCC 205372]|uniref:PE-PGRS family protein n=1 Tax=Mycobacterium hippophais TaxID=3016340 RepID=A0ABT4Q0N7_9MYCO|nr:hypothetical protein [Mycobacterium hippophais]MCZ8382402.1 hypothetical protein [Mycobacterium hippophais]